MPSDSEAFRLKYTSVCNAWLFARARYTSRDWLTSLQRDTYTTLAKCILGSKLKGLKSAPIGDDKVILMPEWTIALEYQQEVRKKAYEFVRESHLDLVAALGLAIKHEETRSIFLTAPFTQRISRYGKKSFSLEPRELPWMRGAKDAGYGASPSSKSFAHKVGAKGGKKGSNKDDGKKGSKAKL